MAYITLNKNHFFNNLDIITNHTKTKDKIALVLKDNAYGHGLIEVSKMAQEYGISKCVVQSNREAQIVESYFEYVLILADFPINSSEKFRYAINDINAIDKFHKGTKVELKVDTGMHRNGIAKEELYTAFKKIKENELLLEAVFTHHRNADELNSEWFWQNGFFKKVKLESLKYAKEFDFKNLKFHSSNSAALFRTPDFNEDIARVGIAAFGCMQLPTSLAIDGFRPVLSLYASKISSRILKAGDRVGYGATYEVKEESIVSNYDFGYGAGFMRLLSNNYTSPDGYKLIGRISMDNASFLTQQKRIKIFDNAIDVAKSAQTIAYEVLTSLSRDIKREII